MIKAKPRKVEDSIEVMRSLIAEWRDALGPYEAWAGLHASRAWAVLGLTNHTMNLADAALTLRDAGCRAEIMPLVRQAIECAVTAQWLSLANAAVLSLTHEDARQRKELLKSFEGVGVGDAPALSTEAQDLVDTLKEEATAAGRYFEQRCLAIRGGAQVYALYRAASAQCHAGSRIADLYMVVRPGSDEPPQVAYAPDKPFDEADAWMGVLATMVVLAGLAWNSIDVDRRFRASFRAAARRLDVPVEPQLTDKAWADDSRAERRIRRVARGRARGGLHDARSGPVGQDLD